MNVDAYKILDQIGLKRPKVYLKKSIREINPNKYYFLRYGKDVQKSNKVILGKNLISSKKEIIRELDSGILLFIESKYNSIGGGVSLIKNGFSYLEYVKGHVISLLRRGLCGGRILIKTKNILKIIPSFQGWEAKQNKEYSWKPTLGPSKSTLERIGRKLSNILPESHKGLILEWMETKDSIIFCDARDTGLENFGNKLLNLALNKTDVHLLPYSNKQQETELIIDGFDIDLRKSPQDYNEIIAYNGSVLSHYITKNINKNINIILRLN